MRHLEYGPDQYKYNITRLLHLALSAGHHGVVAAVVLLATLVHVVLGLLAVITHTTPVAVVGHGQQRQEAAASLEIDASWVVGQNFTSCNRN